MWGDGCRPSDVGFPVMTWVAGGSWVLTRLSWCGVAESDTDRTGRRQCLVSVLFVKEEIHVLVPGPESNPLERRVGLDWVYLIVFTY
jgi:hypothetical protein